MKFSVGYQLCEEGERPFADIVGEYRDHIAEVYFPWADMPSGRAPLSTTRGYTDWTAQERLENDLVAFRKMGLKLDLLFNASCYGGGAVSKFLENQVTSVIDHLGNVVGGVDTVTTMSLAVAHTVKASFPRIEVRASINMRVGTIKGMQYVADLFDGYHVQREYNRDLEHLSRLRQWADANGKKLYILVNSGCMRFCSGQTFHDNMVSHETEIDETANIPGWTPHVCWNFLRDRSHWPAVLQNTWVRPEDLHHYDGLFPVVKLATRMHSRPQSVIRAYVEGRYSGNLLDLFEPGFSPAFHPEIIDNQKFPEDWFDRTSHCDKNCESCGYCASVLDKVLTRIEDAG